MRITHTECGLNAIAELIAMMAHLGKWIVLG
jgi:hypothetical protein